MIAPLLGEEEGHVIASLALLIVRALISALANALRLQNDGWDLNNVYQKCFFDAE